MRTGQQEGCFSSVTSGGMTSRHEQLRDVGKKKKSENVWILSKLGGGVNLIPTCFTVFLQVRLPQNGQKTPKYAKILKWGEV